MFKWWDKFVDWLLSTLGIYYCDDPSSDEEIERITEDMDMFGVYTWPINPPSPSATEGQGEDNQHNTGA